MPESSSTNTDLPLIRKIEHPVAFLAGVRKSGTSTLFDMLTQHSEITPPAIKEPHFFSFLPEIVDNHLDWYLDLFPQDKGRMLIDGSTLCFGSRYAPDLIKNHFFEAKIVFVLRDPAKRAFSSYLHAHKKSECNDKRSFDDILSSLEGGIENANLLEAEATLLRAAVNQGLVNEHIYGKDFLRKLFGAPFDVEMDDPLFSYNYFRESHYRDGIERFSRVFGREVIVVFFEELVSNPRQQLQRILEFLDLPFEESVCRVPHKNQTVMPKNKLARWLLHIQETNRGARTATQLFKKLGLKELGVRLRSSYFHTSPPTLTERQYQRARSLLEDEFCYWIEHYPFLEDLWRYRSG